MISTVPQNWQEVRANDICSLITNGFVGKATSHYTESEDGVLYIQGYNVKENSFEFRGIKKVTREFHEKNRKSQLKKWDLLTIQTGDVGLTTIVPTNLEGSNCHALIISRFIEDKAYPPFMAQYYNSPFGRMKLKKIEFGSTMKHINISALKKLKIHLPPLPEQNRIVSVLETWDKVIEKLERKIELKKNVKKGLMQQLLTGRKRLPGFSGEWEEAKLGEIASCLDNRRQPLNSEERSKIAGEYPYCGANGIVDYVNNYMFDEDIILIAEDGGYFDEYLTRPVAYRMKQKCWVNNHAHVIRVKENFSQGFLYYSTIHKNLMPYLSGGTRAKLNKSELMKVTYNAPIDIAEQEGIANILTSSDQEIDLLQSKLLKLRDQKTYLLNNLITGRIRTPESMSLSS